MANGCTAGRRLFGEIGLDAGHHGVSDGENQRAKSRASGHRELGSG
jgi:hypothetical protein